MTSPQKSLPDSNHHRASRLKTLRQRFADLLTPLHASAFAISDLSALSYVEMKMMLRNIRRKAQSSGWPVVPVIVTCHTKNIIDFKPIEKFCRLLAAADDVEVITCTELARNLQSGMYPVVPAVSRRQFKNHI